MNKENIVISVKNIVTRFGERTIHDGVSLSIKENEIYGILGESGSGKSVLMKEMIMLLEPNAGEVIVLGKILKGISYKDAQQLRREWGVLFQFGALYSSMTIAENIEVQLKEYTSITKEMRDSLVRSKIALVGLDAHVGSLYPSELSGGMIKRAALARALAMEPKLLFLDEPFSSLDIVTRMKLLKMLKNLWTERSCTAVMVTHDPFEAAFLSTRVIVTGRNFKNYHIVKTGSPAERNLTEVLSLQNKFIGLLEEMVSDA